MKGEGNKTKTLILSLSGGWYELRWDPDLVLKKKGLFRKQTRQGVKIRRNRNGLIEQKC